MRVLQFQSCMGPTSEVEISQSLLGSLIFSPLTIKREVSNACHSLDACPSNACPPLHACH